MKERVIGVDLGTKTMGLAISDRLGLAGHPLETYRFAPGNYQAAKDYLFALCQKESVVTIAIGYPLHMSGQISERALSVTRFKEEFMAEHPGIAIHPIDERLTTVMANKLMLGAERNAHQRKETIDAAAAVLILESFLQRSKNDGIHQ